MDFQVISKDLKERNLIQVVGDKLQKRPKAMTAEEIAIVEQHTPEILAALTDRPVTDFLEFEHVTYKPAVQVATLETQLENYKLWLAGRAGAIGAPNHYYSPSQAEFDTQVASTRLIAEKNGGKVKLHFNYAFSWMSNCCRVQISAPCTRSIAWAGSMESNQHATSVVVTAAERRSEKRNG